MHFSHCDPRAIDLCTSTDDFGNGTMSAQMNATMWPKWILYILTLWVMQTRTSDVQCNCIRFIGCVYKYYQLHIPTINSYIFCHDALLHPYQLPLEYTSNRKEATEEKLFQTFDLAVSLTLFRSIPESNQFICCWTDSWDGQTCSTTFAADYLLNCSFKYRIYNKHHLTSHLYDPSRVDVLPGGIHGTLVLTLAVGRKQPFTLTCNDKSKWHVLIIWTWLDTKLWCCYHLNHF